MAMRRREFLGVLGGAAVMPFAARAQQSLPVVGFLSGRALAQSQIVLAAFRQGLADAGFVEGHNVAVEYRWADGRYERLPALAAELVRLPVTALAATGATAAIHAAKNATAKIPVVFVTAEDPISAGIVSSFNRPGGNVTGMSFLAAILGTKQLDLIRMLVPKAQTIAVMSRPDNPSSVAQLVELRAAARALGLQIVEMPALSIEQIEATFLAALRERADALILVADPTFGQQAARIAELAAQHALPTLHNLREFVAAGGLMSYGSSITDAYRQIGVYTGRVLKGEKPADLPVLQPTKYEFILNLKTAKTLGLTIPPTLLALADEVIE
jgi:putative ABC transport system substrate-binding protein